MATTLALASPAAAKDKSKPAKPAARTWKTVVDHVLANGTPRPLRAPLSRQLGFNSDDVATTALRYKSSDTPDKMTHSVHVVTAKGADGKSIPMEIVLGSRATHEKDGVKSIDDFFVRTTLDGRITAAFSSKGPAGNVVEQKISPDSPAALAAFKIEETIHLKSMSLQKLSR